MTYISRFRTAIGLSLAVLIAACGGGGGGGGGDDTPVTKPQAQITASAESVVIGTTVSFDGIGSSTPSGGSLSYQWELLSPPEGGAATLSSSSASSTELTPDKAGTWTVSLTVNNGTTSSDPLHKSITVTEPPKPVAAIAAINGALPNIAVQLDGSGSTPPTGGQASGLVYEWTLSEKPEASVAALDDASIAYPRFTPDKEGAYKVQLVVRYDGLASETVEQSIEVFAESAAPTSVPKVLSTTLVRGQTIELSGVDSINPDGQPLNYFWRWGTAYGQAYPTTGRPVGSSAAIQTPNAATASFVADMVGTYQVQLMVWSGKRVGIAALTIRVTKPEGAANTRPVAGISPTYYTYSYEAEPSISTSAGVYLGSANSYDADGDTMTREWTLLSYPAGFDVAKNYTPGTYAYFLPTHVGDYVAQLRVFDGTEWSDPVSQVYTVRTGANIGPTATIKTAIGAVSSTLGGASLRATTMVGVPMVLDGSQSNGGNGDRVYYNWELAYKPEGSTTKLSDTGATYPSFTADKEGPYLVRLRIQDAYGLWSRNTPEILVVAKGSNSPPVLRPTIGQRYGALSDEQPMVIDVVPITGFYLSPNALDPDGDTVDTLCTLVEAPAGFEWPEVRQWTRSTNSTRDFDSHTSGFIGTPLNGSGHIKLTGTYVFELIGSDGMAETATHRVRLPAATVAEYPGLLVLSGSAIGDFVADGQHVLGYPDDGTFLGFATFTNSYWQTLPDSPTTGISRRFKLQAPAGKTYTIVDLKAESDDPTVPVSFIGLTEGQVIQAGAPVLFSLGVQRFPEDRTEDFPETPYPKARWSFGVKENPALTFRVETFLQGKWNR